MKHNLRSEEFLSDAMKRYGDTVYRLALCRLGSHTDAEDAYQEVFLRLLKDDTDFKDGEHLKAWLLKVASSRCTDMRRTAWFRHTAPLEAAANAKDETNQSSDELWQLVAALPENLRTAVYLHYVEGYSADEIAAITKCRPATVRTRLYRARKKLKLYLEGEDDEKPERAFRLIER